MERKTKKCLWYLNGYGTHLQLLVVLNCRYVTQTNCGIQKFFCPCLKGSDLVKRNGTQSDKLASIDKFDRRHLVVKYTLMLNSLSELHVNTVKVILSTLQSMKTERKPSLVSLATVFMTVRSSVTESTTLRQRWCCLMSALVCFYGFTYRGIL